MPVSAFIYLFGAFMPIEIFSVWTKVFYEWYIYSLFSHSIFYFLYFIFFKFCPIVPTLMRMIIDKSSPKPFLLKRFHIFCNNALFWWFNSITYLLRQVCCISMIEIWMIWIIALFPAKLHFYKLLFSFCMILSLCFRQFIISTKNLHLIFKFEEV